MGRSRGLGRIRWWTWAHRVTAGVFLLVLILGRFGWFPWVKGSTVATHLFGFLWLADPMAGLEVTLATRHLTTPLAVAAGLLLIFYALLGRVFCGWVCPLGLVLDLNDDLRDRLARRLRRHHHRFPDVPLPGELKYWLLALFLLLSLTARLPAFQLISPINILARALIFAPGPALFLVGAIVALEYVSRRVWCRALCPLGAFYSLVARFGRVRVLVEPEKAGKVRCRLCTLRCPMGIRVMEDYALAGRPAVTDPECTGCGTCVDACPQQVLRLGLEVKFRKCSSQYHSPLTTSFQQPLD